jgi:hypothetical protein
MTGATRELVQARLDLAHRMLTQQDPLMRNWHLGSGESAFLSWTNNQARYPVNPGT